MIEFIKLKNGKDVVVIKHCDIYLRGDFNNEYVEVYNKYTDKCIGFLSTKEYFTCGKFR